MSRRYPPEQLNREAEQRIRRAVGNARMRVHIQQPTCPIENHGVLENFGSTITGPIWYCPNCEIALSGLLTQDDINRVLTGEHTKTHGEPVLAGETVKTEVW